MHFFLEVISSESLIKLRFELEEKEYVLSRVFMSAENETNFEIRSQLQIPITFSNAFLLPSDAS